MKELNKKGSNKMDYHKFIGKIVADKNSYKLGKAIKIEEILDDKTKISKPHLLVLVKNFLQRDIVVVVEIDKILRSDDRYIWLDLLKEDFDQEVRETRALIKLYKDI